MAERNDAGMGAREALDATESTLPAGHALPGGADSSDPVVVTGSRREPAHVGEVLAGMDHREDPDGTRDEIVRTRARMSETIDQIEEQLLRRKLELQEKLDVKAQIRDRLEPVSELVYSRPLAVFGGVFGAALVLGFLTGGRDEDEAEWEPAAELALHAAPGGRRGRWRNRALELQRRNELLEDEVATLRARLDRDLDGGGLSGAVAGAVGALFGGRRARRAEPVFHLEEDDVPGDYHPSASYDQYAHSHHRMGREPGDPLQG